MSRPSASQSRSWLGGYIRIAKNKTSLPTLRSYLSRGGQQWFVGALIMRSRLMGWRSFLSCYRALLERVWGLQIWSSTRRSLVVERDGPGKILLRRAGSSSSEAPVSQKNAVSYMAASLDQPAQLCGGELPLGPIAGGAGPARAPEAHVRATYLSEPLFRQLLRGMERMTHTSSSYRECLSALYIVAYRAGLRRSEIQKLQVKDIERSPECGIYPRDTRLDDGRVTVHPQDPLGLADPGRAYSIGCVLVWVMAAKGEKRERAGVFPHRAVG